MVTNLQPHHGRFRVGLPDIQSKRLVDRSRRCDRPVLRADRGDPRGAVLPNDFHGDGGLIVMKTFLVIVAAVFVSAIGIAAVSGSGRSTSTTSTTATTLPVRAGNPAVYAEIAAETNCSKLQAMFDQADANGKLERRRHNLAMAEVTTSYMEAADQRMRQIGCY